MLAPVGEYPGVSELIGGIKVMLDAFEATRKQLEHGQRVTELMKQKQYSPMTVADMGVVLFAANEGFLEDVEVEKVLDFEAALLDYMNAEHGDFMKEINETGAYSDDIVSTLRDAVEQFKKTGTY